ncbi:Uncharacterised protein [uncultured archaeon]|nr:Uncharacterised protein [uncultured archaeon]
MRNRKRDHLKVMRHVFLAVLMVSILSITAFSFQAIYSNNVRVDIARTYGILQNGVFLPTDGVIVPSPYSVQTANITVQNTENSTRAISISVDYKGALASADPRPSETPGTLTWVANFSPLETKVFVVMGKELEVSDPVVTVVGIPQSQPAVSDKKLLLDNLSNKTHETSQQQNFSYVREDEVTDLLLPVFAEQKKLDVVAKSLIIIFAGLVVLTLAGGLASVFGSDDKPRPSASEKGGAKIHIGDMYHNGDDSGEFSKYKYEESDYWK